MKRFHVSSPSFLTDGGWLNFPMETAKIVICNNFHVINKNWTISDDSIQILEEILEWFINAKHYLKSRTDFVKKRFISWVFIHLFESRLSQYHIELLTIYCVKNFTILTTCWHHPFTAKKREKNHSIIIQFKSH